MTDHHVRNTAPLRAARAEEVQGKSRSRSTRGAVQDLQSRHTAIHITDAGKRKHAALLWVDASLGRPPSILDAQL